MGPRDGAGGAALHGWATGRAVNSFAASGLWTGRKGAGGDADKGGFDQPNRADI